MTDNPNHADIASTPNHNDGYHAEDTFFDDGDCDGYDDAEASLMALEDTLAQLAQYTPSNTPQTQAPDNHAYGSQAPLRAHVEHVVRAYFAALGDDMPTDLYALILQEVEAPLLQVVLEQTRGNQTKCAQVLGLNRGTLRKKLKTYGLMD